LAPVQAAGPVRRVAVRRRALLGPLLLLALGGGCAREQSTGIVVEVSTDLDVPGEVDRLRVRVWDAGQQAPRELVIDLCAGGATARLPGRLPLLPDDPSQAAPV